MEIDKTKQLASEVIKEADSGPMTPAEAPITSGIRYCVEEERFHENPEIIRSAWMRWAHFLKSLEGRKIEKVVFLNLQNIDHTSPHYNPLQCVITPIVLLDGHEKHVFMGSADWIPRKTETETS